MEEKKSQRTLWITVAVIVGLLLSCCIGASLGGLLGYAAGARSGARSQLNPVSPRQTVIPELPWSREPTQPRSPTSSLGAIVVEVTAGSPAESAGIRQNDIIIAVNGQGLSSETNLAKRVSALAPGDKATLLLLRQGRQRNVTVTVGRNPDSGGNVPWLGLRYQEMPLSSLDQWGGGGSD
jgi:hypothetical protein